LPRRPFGGKYSEKWIVFVVVNQMNPSLHRQVVAVLVYLVDLQRGRWAQIETMAKGNNRDAEACNVPIVTLL
jgi:hypothetical protein